MILAASRGGHGHAAAADADEGEPVEVLGLFEDFVGQANESAVDLRGAHQLGFFARESIGIHRRVAKTGGELNCEPGNEVGGAPCDQNRIRCRRAASEDESVALGSVFFHRQRHCHGLSGIDARHHRGEHGVLVAAQLNHDLLGDRIGEPPV